MEDGRGGDEGHDHGDNHGAVGVGSSGFVFAPNIECCFDEQVHTQSHHHPARRFHLTSIARYGPASLLRVCDTDATVRKLIHIDIDCFYAAVEERDNPALKGRPVAVAWEGPRGVVMTANYAARAFGVRSALATSTALRRCPQLTLVPPRLEVYRAVSKTVQALFHSYTDLVEPLSLDEAYLDVTHPKQGPPSGTRLAELIRRDVKTATGLSASAGVSYNKFLAKLALGLAKPDGLTVILPRDATVLK